ncbi:phosphoribosylaminoimidazolesuccinocarboxamide synthase [Geovibrio thiophilus]|uniref:Phosphoribosylaminoimidazole-succinocarboxamide synthase n=1 Tax=Geovibrio thiophilus TaxID=139438 RepID=A0A3R5XYF9_9BACT|nr:phosphoribosylaminoimidazolesuccinocarboxamide synthase [Geovibrio thiophilus]QAR34313.1 phosphoribosylaminoimidazolesuccinocarboxamide synthase [Geovibrio thiophilus]
MDTILRTDMPQLNFIGSGKVRDIYDLGDQMLIVTTDRISAFDVVLPNGIPGKGKVLTKLSKFWFENTADIVENHLLTTEVDEMPEICREYRSQLEGRSMLVKKAKPFPFECVVRGYITGSGWKDYKSTGEICGIKLPAGLLESQKFETPLFTPATKAEVGDHDENVSFERMASDLGRKDAEELKRLTVAVYERARDIADAKGIIIADTKLEFGMYGGKIILIDEVLTPDSSRFWKKASYQAGKPQDSMDKQYVRDYLETLDWNKTAPGPKLPDDVARKTSEIYHGIMDILMK